MDAAGDDPVERLAAEFRAYCVVVDEHRHAAMLTYRESRTLGSQARARIKHLEVSTERYVATQSALFLNALVEPRHRRRYRRLLEPPC